MTEPGGHPTPSTDPLFADLFSGPGCYIPATEKRAISLDQLGLIMEHITRRLTEKGEVWTVYRKEEGVVPDKFYPMELTDPLKVQLYDCDKKVINPATKQQQLSLVEAMSEHEQPPDYFTSHWYTILNGSQFLIAYATYPGGASLYT